uniref:Putative secreted protein n=1 Tax=Rhipicephalus microplus TaxID=6941 RepID=A0A6M2D6U3_RHIMP
MEETKICAALLTMVIYAIALPTISGLNEHSGSPHMNWMKGVSKVALTRKETRAQEAQQKVPCETDGAPCRKGVWQGQCFYGECVQEYIGAPNSDKDDGNEEHCLKYKLNTKVNNAVTTCSYWCSEGSTPYNVYVLNGILCAKSENTNGICMDGECDTKQQLTMAVLYNPTPRKQSDELASGITSLSLSTESNFTHSTSSSFDVTYQTTTNSDPRNSEAVTNVEYTKVINAATKLEGTRPVEVAYTTRLPYVIFTDFFQKFATAGVPLE